MMKYHTHLFICNNNKKNEIFDTKIFVHKFWNKIEKALSLILAMILIVIKINLAF